MEKILQDKIAIVTGGAQGLGAAICLRLAQEGAHVVIADLNVEGAEADRRRDRRRQTGPRTSPSKWT